MEGRGAKKKQPKRSGSDILTKRQLAVILPIIVLIGIALVVLFWRGFPVGNTIMPILIGGIFIAGVCYNIKTGFFTWKGGARIYRANEPFSFWFWISVFAFFGLFGVFVGTVQLLKTITGI